MQGGADAASPRYIFTLLNALTRMIFNEYDDPLLKYLDDDGQSIEPEWCACVCVCVYEDAPQVPRQRWPRQIVVNLIIIHTCERVCDLLPALTMAAKTLCLSGTHVCVCVLECTDVFVYVCTQVYAHSAHDSDQRRSRHRNW